MRKHRQSWQNTLIYLMASLLTLGMTCYTPGNAQAESRTSQPVVQKLDSPALQLYTAGVQMAPLIPDLLGFTKPKSYLLLVQNNQELRATGGFITAVGKLTVANGRITSINFVDSFNIAPNNVDHPLAPDPLKRFMDIPILFLRDANWSPDFPTSARMASSIYAQDTGVQVDGVITIDLRAVQFLVGALAPLQIPGSDVPLTADNVIQEMLTLRENPLENGSPQGKSNPAPTDGSWYLQRKDFIPLMAEAALARLQSGRFSIFRLINAVTSSLDERAVQIWLDNPTAANLLAHYGWDGQLTPEADSDFLALIDTNMGYNKVDAVIKRSITHSIAWPKGASAQATVTVTYRHTVNAIDNVCKPGTIFYKSSMYKEMTERCYFDYVRLYVPGDSKLIAIDGVDAGSVSDQPGERGTQVFAGYFILKPGEQHTVTFTYTLPPTITPQNYRLVLQRQAGSDPLPVSISVDNNAFDSVLDTTLEDGSLIWPAPSAAIAKAR